MVYNGHIWILDEGHIVRERNHGLDLRDCLFGFGA